MSAHPEEEARAQRKDTLRNLGIVGLVGIAAAAIVLLFEVLFGVNTVVGHIAKSQIAHNNTLSAIAQTQKTELANQKQGHQSLQLLEAQSAELLAQTADLNALLAAVAKEQTTETSGSATVTRILQEAGGVSASLLQNEYAICLAVKATGCTASLGSG